MPERIRRRAPVPEPIGPEGEALEARVRAKFGRGDPLDDAERAFLASLPADKDVPADVVRASARAHGGEEPIDAATGRMHDPDAPPR